MNLIDSASLGLPDFEPGYVWLVGLDPVIRGCFRRWRYMPSPVPTPCFATPLSTREFCVWHGPA